MAKKKKDKSAEEEEKESLEESSDETEEEEAEAEEAKDSDKGDSSDDSDSDDETSEEEADSEDDPSAEDSDGDGDDSDGDGDDSDGDGDDSDGDGADDSSGDSDEGDSDEDDSDEDEVAASAKKAKKSDKKAQKAKKSDKKAQKAAAEEPRTEPKRPGMSSDPDEVSQDIRDIFGLADDGASDNAADYIPDEKAGISMGSLIGLVVVIGILVGLVFFAIDMLEKREAELQEKEEEAKLAAEEAKEPSVRYGNIALMASTPSNALILRNGEPIFAKTSTGAWTELRAGPSTRIQNVKIKEGETIKYTLVSEGYKPYEIELTEYDWVPIPGTADFEKIYHNIRLEPEDRPFLLNCDAVKNTGPEYATACDVSVTDEIRTRQDYERIYDARLNGTMTIESNPPGAKIFYLTEPLLKPDGTQATTPYEFMVYGKIEAGEDEGKDKKIKITDDLSVRLEKDGFDPYIAEIKSHQWKCDPFSSPDDIAKIEVPEKVEKDAPDMIHHLCSYSYTINGKLFEPGKGPGARPKGEGEGEGEGEGDQGEDSGEGE